MSSVSRAIARAAIVFALVLAGCDDDPGDPGTFCGNGKIDPGEACDEGRKNSDERPGACRTNCALPSCGDGVVDPGEGCDDGAANSDRVAGACRETCVPASCGDGVRDPGEGCDDGEANGPKARCRPNCALGTCGDGVVDPGEECDDGVRNDDEAIDGCRTTCVAAYCGDGVPDTGEGCDEGVENDDALPGACRTSCVPADCGDGVVDPGEECDDGPGNDDRYPGFCRTSCRLPHCGDGVIDEGESCDDGPNNSDTRPDACRTDCRAPSCGDGVRDLGEECDEGEDNDDVSAHACRTSCRLPHCGDGVIGAGEQCDDGAANDDVTPGACRTSCRRAHCGDGVRDEGEGCDDGDRNSDEVSGACRTDCRMPYCGDGVVDAGETCDDGAPGAIDGCSAGCGLAIPASCFAPELPLHDLRAVGTPDGNGFVVNGALPDGYGQVSTSGCYAPATEVFYAFPVTVAGDLVVEVEPSPEAPEFEPVVAVRRGCVLAQVGCATATGGPGPVHLIVPGVTPAEGVYVVQVDGLYGSEGSEYTLRVHVRPPLAAGDPCTTSGTLGRCPAGSHLCADPDGDGAGHCLPIVEAGSACDSAASVCREPSVCREGICGDSCGDGIVQPWESCDDGNTDEADGCTSICTPSPFDCANPYDLTSRWDPVARHVSWTSSTEGQSDEIHGPCNTRNAPDAVASFVAPEAGRYSFRHAGPGTWGLLAVLDSCSSSAGVRGCATPPNSSGGEQGLWVELAAGEQVYLVADARSYGTGPFEVHVDRPICGDGVVQGLEECDDGNTADGDTCGKSCTLPGLWCLNPYPLSLGTGPTATWQGQFTEPDAIQDFVPSCSSTNRTDVVATFIAPATGRYSFRAEAIVGGASVGIFASQCSNELACASTTTTDVPAVADLVLYEGQKVWVAVDADLRGFTLTAGRLSCGDGERVLPEECDDGNLVPGDGCDATCHVETVAEVEPNDVRATAQPLAVGKILRGALGEGDIDFVALPLTAGQRYEFETYVGAWERCDAPTGGVDTALILHGPTGEVLASNSASGILGCSLLAYTAEVTGVHYLRVQEYPWSTQLPEGIPVYFLRTATVAP